MATPFPDESDLPDDEPDDDLPTSSQKEIARWLQQLHRSDRTMYDLMALEVWSIAQTMDHLIPGFWNRFMENRQLALQEFLTQRQAQGEPPPDSKSDPSTAEENGMMEGDE